MGLNLAAGQTVFIDTAPFIYYIEEKSHLVTRMARFLDMALGHSVQLVTSMITYIELLTLPERHGNHALAGKYRDFLTNSESLSIYPLNTSVADVAVRLRAAHHLKTPDAVQLATAQVCGADHVLTNDRRWGTVPGFSIVLVSELEVPES